MNAKNSPLPVKSFFDVNFWLAGAATLGFAILLLAWQFFDTIKNVESVVSGSIEQTRRGYPELEWAFSEIEFCYRGGGIYSKNGFLTRAQCDDAVMNMAKLRGQDTALSGALKNKDITIAAALKKVSVPWPLSVFYDESQ